MEKPILSQPDNERNKHFIARIVALLIVATGLFLLAVHGADIQKQKTSADALPSPPEKILIPPISNPEVRQLFNKSVLIIQNAPESQKTSADKLGKYVNHKLNQLDLISLNKLKLFLKPNLGIGYLQYNKEKRYFRL